MKKSFKIMIVLAAMLMVLGTVSTVFASEDTPEEPTHERDGEGRMAVLAEQLGITEEELQDKLDSGMTIKEIAEELGVELPVRGEGPKGYGQMNAERIAEVFGITVEELQAKIDSGMTIQEIAEELGVEMSGKGDGQMNIERMAEQFGITEEELQDKLNSGMTIKEIAEELGVELPGKGGRGGEGRPTDGERPARDGEGVLGGRRRGGQTSED